MIEGVSQGGAEGSREFSLRGPSRCLPWLTSDIAGGDPRTRARPHPPFAPGIQGWHPGASPPSLDILNYFERQSLHQTRGGSPLPERSDRLDIGRRHAVLGTLLTVTVLPTSRGRRPDGSYFDPTGIHIDWNTWINHPPHPCAERVPPRDLRRDEQRKQRCRGLFRGVPARVPSPRTGDDKAGKPKGEGTGEPGKFPHDISVLTSPSELH